jgi:hypothetical protein
MDLYKGIFGEPCAYFAKCGNYVYIHGSLCPDCEDAADERKSVVVCVGCGSTDDGFGFANGTCANCGSMSFDI